MDLRTALLKGDNIVASRNDGEKRTFIINKEIGRGASCITYDASYYALNDTIIPIRLKEFYPFSERIKRENNGSLQLMDNTNLFDKKKDAFLDSFKRNVELFSTNGLTNYVASPEDAFFANNTVYLVYTYAQDKVLSFKDTYTLAEILDIITDLSIIIGKIHELGYLYLDLKPDNIAILKGEKVYIRLLDFDSIISINTKERDFFNQKISYSKGFSAVEQIMASGEIINKSSDIFGIGAILFYLIFKRPVESLDTDTFAIYDYTCTFLPNEARSKDFYNQLNNIFHHTICNYTQDRYKDTNELLQEIRKLQDLASDKYFYIQSDIVSSCKKLFGRERELDYIRKWYQNPFEKVLIVSGIRGIGKSSVVIEYIKTEKDIDNFVYVSFQNSLTNTICDDYQVKINGINKEEKESLEEYFERKLVVLSELFQSGNNILIVDNYIGDFDSTFGKLLSINWKIIVITKERRIDKRFETFLIGELSQKKELLEMFLYYSNLGENYDEEIVYALIDKCYSHTLTVELCARQIKRRHITVKKMSSLINTFSLSKDDMIKVDYYRDDTKMQDSIPNILGFIFETTQLSNRLQNLLNIICVFSEILIDDLFILYPEASLDDLNDLEDQGWIYVDDTRVRVHGLIRETVNRKSVNGIDDVLNDVAEKVYITIKISATHNNYPKELADFLSSQKCIDRYNKNVMYLRKKGIYGQVAIARMNESDYSVPVDRKKLNRFFKHAILLIDYNTNNPCIDDLIVKSIQHLLVLYLPIKEENLIISYAEDILNTKGLKLDDRAYMDISERLIDIYCLRRDFTVVKVLLDKVRRYARWRGNYAKARYHDMLGWYYDCLIDGDYDNEFNKKVLEETQLAIKYISKCKKVIAKQLEVKYKLSLANICMRSNTAKDIDVYGLLVSIKDVIENGTLQYDKVRLYYYMVCARYFTSIETNYNGISESIRSASKLADIILNDDIERIDDVLVPAAEIFFNIKKYESAEYFLNVCLELCSNHKDVAPFEKKREEILRHLLDVHSASGDIKKYNKIVGELHTL